MQWSKKEINQVKSWLLKIKNIYTVIAKVSAQFRKIVRLFLHYLNLR